MRQIHRPQIALPVLCTGVGWKKAEEHRRSKALDPKARLEFPDSAWNKPEVRGALHAMQGWVCAYCQCELTRSDRGDVDHFRPKQGDDGKDAYWWLAYQFDNYLLACRACNSWRKGHRFPLAPGAACVEYANRADLCNEARLLAHPVDDPVEGWLRVEWKDPAREAHVVIAEVKVSNGLPADGVGLARATETIRFFKLNLDPGLYTERLRRLGEATKHHRTGETTALRRMASRYQPFGIAVRNYLEEVAPELLPTPTEELSWLLQDLGDRLETAMELLGRAPEVELAVRMVDQLCWSLAVLWKDPPTGDAGRAQVERWLENIGWKDEVEKRYRKLTPPSPAGK